MVKTSVPKISPSTEKKKNDAQLKPKMQARQTAYTPERFMNDSSQMHSKLKQEDLQVRKKISELHNFIQSVKGVFQDSVRLTIIVLQLDSG